MRLREDLLASSTCAREGGQKNFGEVEMERFKPSKVTGDDSPFPELDRPIDALYIYIYLYNCIYIYIYIFIYRKM